MDGPGDALAAGADEEGRTDDPGSPAVDPELVPSPRRGLIGGRGGAEQQGETGDEKVVRLPDLGSGETGFVAQPRPPSRAETRPQILLTRLFLMRGQSESNQAAMACGSR